jgi:hypothetical protein
MVRGKENQNCNANASKGSSLGRKAVEKRMDLSIMQCIIREKDDLLETVESPPAPNFECEDEPEPEVSPPSSTSSMSKYLSSQEPKIDIAALSTAYACIANKIFDQYQPASDVELLDVSTTCSLRSTTVCSGSDVYSRESSFCEERWDDSHSWRFCRVWEDLPSPSPLTLSPRLEEEPVILCCARKDQWCPLAVDQSSVVGNLFFAQGVALHVRQDYTDLFTVNITNAVAGDPTDVVFRSADDGQYVCLLSSRLCTSSLLQGMAGHWAKMELRPAVPGNHYCFHLYSPDSMAPHAAPVPICYDEGSNCLVQADPAPGCEAAVFSLQTASSALMLKEIVDLTQQCAEQRRLSNHLNNLYRLQKLAAIPRGTSAQYSEEFQRLAYRRDMAEQQHVFLEDELCFMKEQLKFNLQYAGVGAAHGLPEACIPLPECSVSGKPEICKSSVSPLYSVKKALRLL